jgi:hypothetical protein
MIVVYSLKRDGEKQLSKNFKVKEFACKDGSDKILIDDELVVILQQIRNRIGAVNINSGYRTISYNNSIGGADGSHHTTGQAADISFTYPIIREVAMFAESIDVKTVILYDTFIHVGSNRVGNMMIDKKVIPTFIPSLKREYIFHTNKNEVYTAQKYLKIKGYYTTGAMDSKFGPIMQSAVKNFQKNRNLTVTGIINKATWKELLK